MKKRDNNHRCCELHLSAALPPASERTAELPFHFGSIRKAFTLNHICFSETINIKGTQKYSVVVIRRGAMEHLEPSTHLIMKIKSSR